MLAFVRVAAQARSSAPEHCVHDLFHLFPSQSGLLVAAFLGLEPSNAILFRQQSLLKMMGRSKCGQNQRCGRHICLVSGRRAVLLINYPNACDKKVGQIQLAGRCKLNGGENELSSANG